MVVVGIEFPRNPTTGQSSTTAFAKEAWARSIEKEDAQAAQAIRAESQWRESYSQYVERHVAACLRSPASALRMATEGLQYVHQHFHYTLPDGQTRPLSQFASLPPAFRFHTGIVRGENRRQKNLAVTYHDRRLKKDALLAQLAQWEAYGTLEPSVTRTLRDLLAQPERLDLSDQFFVLFGAGSAMGPYRTLMELGAHVLAVDIDRPAVWRHLIKKAKRSAGTLYFPTRQPQSGTSSRVMAGTAGCNLLTEAIEIAHWLDDTLQSLPSPPSVVTVGSYVYLDGEKHVRLVMSCDAITLFLTRRPQRTIRWAFLCTPTDCHPIPMDARHASQQAYEAHSPSNIILSPLRVISRGRWLHRNMHCDPVEGSNGQTYAYINAIVRRQGPNYIFAKRIQHWRTIVALHAPGQCVSANVAPSTATSSVVNQRSFAWAYDGMPFFPPMEIFQQNTSSQLMAALLIADITRPHEPQYDNPLEIFRDEAVHGGIWRMAYTMDSIAEPSAAIHFLKVAAASSWMKAALLGVTAVGGYRLYSRL